MEIKDRNNLFVALNNNFNSQQKHNLGVKRWKEALKKELQLRLSRRPGFKSFWGSLP